MQYTHTMFPILLVLAGLAQAQDPPVVLEIANLEQAISDPQDAGIRDSLAMAEAALRGALAGDEELAGELCLFQRGAGEEWIGDPPADGTVRLLALHVDVEALARKRPELASEVTSSLRRIEVRLERVGSRYHLHLRLVGAGASARLLPDLDLLRSVPERASWATLGFWESATIAERLRESDTEGAEDWTWLDDLLGGPIAVYGLPTDTGADLSVVHMLRPVVEVQDLMAVLPERLEPLVGPLGGVELSKQDGTSLLTVSLASRLMTIEAVATPGGQTIFVAGSPEAALAARARAARSRATGESAGLLGREELSVIQEQPAAKIARVTWFDTTALLRPGHAALTDLFSMLGGMRVELGDPEPGLASFLPPVEALASGPRSWLWVERVQDGDLVLDAPLDSSLTRTVVVLSGVVLTHPWTKAGLELLRLITPVSFEGAQGARVKADLLALRAAIDSYARVNSGRYPSDLRVLVTPDELGNTYLELTELPLDPWGREYLYDPPKDEGRPRAYTLGADGQPGGWGEDADLSTDDVPHGGRFGGRRNIRKKRDD